MYKWRQIYVLLVVITTMSSPHSSMYKWSQIYVLLVYEQMITDICVACPNHNHVLSSFVTMYKWPQIYVLLVYVQMTTDICVTCRNHNHVLSSFLYVQMTTDICVTCRNHNHVLSSFVTMYKWPQIYVLLVVITTMSSPRSSLSIGFTIQWVSLVEQELLTLP